MIVTFDIADGAFEFFTDRQWKMRVEQWREMMLNDGYEFAEDMDEEEMFDEMDRDPVFINGIACFDAYDALEAGKQTPAGKHIVISTIKLNTDDITIQKS